MAATALLGQIYRLSIHYFRPRRFAKFRREFANCASIADFGGRAAMWAGIDLQSRIVLINIDEYPANGYEKVIASGCDCPLRDNTFDLAFSNSAIEHLGTEEAQFRFANEMRRVGRRIFCQTPYYWFPAEVHWLTPIVHWIPRQFRPWWLLRYFTVWGLLSRPNKAEVCKLNNELRLLTKREMQAMFPDCQILSEKFLGLTKSLIAVR